MLSKKRKKIPPEEAKRLLALRSLKKEFVAEQTAVVAQYLDKSWQDAWLDEFCKFLAKRMK
jgi:hypothetical protein